MNANKTLAMLLGLMMILALGLGGANIADAPRGSTTVDPKWLDRIPKEDRAALDEIVGYAPPPFTSDLKWIGQMQDWESLRGRVVVIQSWTTATMGGRKFPERIGTALKSIPENDLVVFALHTPEGAENAETVLKKQAPLQNVTVVIDARGGFCDALGVYKQPVNILVDRSGVVRYAGLNSNGLEKAVDELVKQPLDSSKVAPQRPVEKPAADPATPPSGAFPPITGKVDGAKDLRGQKAPPFFVAEWITKKPNIEGKVVVIDFWATWCHWCVEGIPHMNDLASKFGDSVCCIGISDESQSQFDEGMKKLKAKKNLTLGSFKYALGLDPSAKIKSATQTTGIPHCIVLSKDWTVRWQGHPASLTAETLGQIIKADSASGGGANTPPKTPARKQRGWTS